MGRILIKGGSIISMDPQIKDLAGGDVLIEDGKIAAVRPSIAADDAEVIDASAMIVLPGLINAHVHTWQSALRGVAADWTVAKYMQSMHRGLAGCFRPDDLYIANLMGALNQLHCGTTTLVDWCHSNRTPDHTDAAISGLTDSGARALFLHGSPKPDPKPGQKHFSEVPMPRSEVQRLRKGRFASDSGLVTFGLAILGPYYSVYDVSRADLKLAREFDLIVSMHVSGGTSMNPDGFKRLLKEDLFDAKTNIVHGNDMDHDDVRAIAAKGGKFTVTAEIELQMGYGDPLTGVLQDCGSPISIGSDVEPSARGDMFTAMRVTLQHERNRRIVALGQTEAGKPLDMPLTVRQALEWTTINGAKMAGLDHRIGSLTPGKEADVLLLRADDINMQPVWDPVASVVMQAGVANVDTVLVAGRAVKRHGRLLHPDIPRKAEALRASGERILTEFGWLPREAA
jgi:cytosine/adenosine deaminase-related metal-dependent hydrolase